MQGTCADVLFLNQPHCNSQQNLPRPKQASNFSCIWLFITTPRQSERFCWRQEIPVQPWGGRFFIFMKTPLVRAVRLHKTLVPSTMANPRCFFSLQISTSSEFLLIRWCTGSTCSLSHQLHSPLTAVLHHI